MSQIELGKKYKDIVLGIEGICTSYTKFLTGCDRVNLQRKDKDGHVKDHHTDITCCIEVKKFKQIKIPKAKKDPGGPNNISSKPEVTR